MTPTIPSVTEVITSLSASVANTVISTLTTSIVVILPALAVLWAIRYVLAKVGFGN
jgi:hypothetical protein